MSWFVIRDGDSSRVEFVKYAASMVVVGVGMLLGFVVMAALVVAPFVVLELVQRLLTGTL